MNEIATIDASVFVSAFTPIEPFHAASKACLRQLREDDTQIIVPTLVIPEIAAALSRGQNKPDLGVAFAKKVAELPNNQLESKQGEVLALFFVQSEINLARWNCFRA